MAPVTIARHGLLLVVTAVSLYLLAPALLEVFGAFDQLDDINPLWFVAMIALQVGSYACMWAVQRLSIRIRRWGPVITSQLASNAFGRIVPGGVDVEALQAGAGVGHLQQGAAGGPHRAAVADLAAALGVERRPVQDQLDLVALVGGGELLAVAEQPEDAADPRQQMIVTAAKRGPDAADDVMHAAGAFTGDISAEMLADAGATLLLLPTSDFAAQAAALRDAGIASLLLEGGARLHREAFESGIVDVVQAYVAPRLLGPSCVKWMPEASFSFSGLHERRVRWLGEDVLIEGYVHRPD